ncbi:class I SAM-dependent methyltransferase [Thermodesulfobacteriota bacterium]
METELKAHNGDVDPCSPIFEADAFSRLDDSDDRQFYSMDRFVNHLDSVALKTVEKLIGELIVEEHPRILDLMAGWDSHIPAYLQSTQIVGLGLNQNELKNNKALKAFFMHDLNRDPDLPFPDDYFDAVLNTVSVDYMTKPIHVFTEVGRILKPGGLFLVIFSNRMFPEKAIRIWREAGEEERVIYVEEFFNLSCAFENPVHFVSKGKPRPSEDKYADSGLPSDPIYAVYAEKKGGHPSRKARPDITMDYGERVDRDELAARKKQIKHNLCCPYCGEKMNKWAVPYNPFAYTWDNDFMYICFNDTCPYFVRGWDCMNKQGNCSTSYRLMYNPEKDTCQPVPVPTMKALREGIVE